MIHLELKLNGFWHGKRFSENFKGLMNFSVEIAPSDFLSPSICSTLCSYLCVFAKDSVCADDALNSLVSVGTL
jgi:hypothetical protein